MGFCSLELEVIFFIVVALWYFGILSNTSFQVIPNDKSKLLASHYKLSSFQVSTDSSALENLKSHFRKLDFTPDDKVYT